MQNPHGVDPEAQASPAEKSIMELSSTNECLRSNLFQICPIRELNTYQLKEITFTQLIKWTRLKGIRIMRNND
jgi:hypothetical protein